MTAKEYNALISKNVKAEKYNAVFKLAKEMQEKKLVPTLETLNNIMRAYLSSGLTHKAWKTFEEIDFHRLTPNVFTLNCLVEVRFLLCVAWCLSVAFSLTPFSGIAFQG